MFRFVLVVLAAIGLVSILGGIGLWALILLPLLLFAMVGCPLRTRRKGARWSAAAPRSASSEERFEDWHRLAHAREEVDGWVDGLPGDGRE